MLSGQLDRIEAMLVTLLENSGVNIEVWHEDRDFERTKQTIKTTDRRSEP